ncbi:hypothetical protein [Bacillus sp. ISL-37]|jgi:uncharacterized protein YdaT|uniref:hypothetical protein n=1 Tax=Bacillus sp. ISL-37 TaxID=2819123 RepID=UPI002570AD63|nr:hypothetical protein [Bacillus sp. ISL-37]
MERMIKMPWTKNDYPSSMKNLDPDVREKAIEIANALVEEEHYDDGKAIPIAIDKAREFVENHEDD